jgi:hypothetical protein
MRRKIRLALLPAVILLCLNIHTVLAEECSHGELTPGAEEDTETTGPLITDTTIPQQTGTSTLYIPFFFDISGGNFDGKWHRTDAGGDFHSLKIPAQLFYGLADRTEIYLVVPYEHNWASNVKQPGPGGETSADFGGLGDINLAFKYLLMNETKELPAVSCLFLSAFPTGHHNNLNPRLLGTDQLGDGAFAFTPGFNLYKSVSTMKFYGNFWYTMSTDATVDGKRINPRDVLTVNLAAEYPVSRRWILLGEFVSTWDGGRLIGRKSDEPQTAILSVLPGIEYISGRKWNLAAGVKIDLLGKNIDYGYAPVLAVFYDF